jgi:hypothetical protein
MGGEFLPVELRYVSRTLFLFQLAVQFGFFLVLLVGEVLGECVRTVILSKGMRVVFE